MRAPPVAAAAKMRFDAKIAVISTGYSSHKTSIKTFIYVIHNEVIPSFINTSNINTQSPRVCRILNPKSRVAHAARQLTRPNGPIFARIAIFQSCIEHGS